MLEIVLIVLIVVGIWQNIHFYVYRRNQRQSLKELFDTLPYGFYLELKVYKETVISLQLKNILRLSDQAQWSDILEVFSSQDQQGLSHDMENLRLRKLPFKRTARCDGTQEEIKFVGCCVFDANQSVWAYVVWVQGVAYRNEQVYILEKQNQLLLKEQKKYIAFFKMMDFPLWIYEANLEYSIESGVLKDQPDLKKVFVDDSVAQRNRSVSNINTRQVEYFQGSQKYTYSVKEKSFYLKNDFYTLAYAQDITGYDLYRVKTEQELKNYQQILHSLNTGVGFFSSALRLEFYNEALLSLWGIQSDLLNQQPHYEEILNLLYHHERLPEVADFEKFKQQKLEKLRNATDISMEMMFFEGGFNYRETLLPHPLGGIVLILDDLTLSVTLRRDLRIREQRFSKILMYFACPVIVFSYDFLGLFCNVQAKDRFGEVVKKRYDAIFPKEEKAVFESLLQNIQHSKNHRIPWEQETWRLHYFDEEMFLFIIDAC